MSAIDTYLSALNGWKLQSPATKEELVADLHRAQTNRQQALDEAAQNSDHPGLKEALVDEMSQRHMEDAFIRMCQDILDSNEAEPVTVRPDFARAVRRVAIEFFGEPT